MQAFVEQSAFGEAVQTQMGFWIRVYTKNVEKLGGLCLLDLCLYLGLELCCRKGEEKAVLFLPSCTNTPILLVLEFSPNAFCWPAWGPGHCTSYGMRGGGFHVPNDTLMLECKLLILGRLSIYLIATLISGHILLTLVQEVQFRFRCRSGDEFL